MTKVLMRTTASGPQGTLQAGKVYDLPTTMARDLCKGSYATPVSELPPEDEVPEESEVPEEIAPKKKTRKDTPTATSRKGTKKKVSGE